MTIYILRHGETDLNAKGVMQGRLDQPLNDSGRELAAVTGRAMKDIRFDRCISSPLKRAAETAEIILRESENDIPIMFDDRLLEIDFGDLEGKKLCEMGDAGNMFFTAPFRFKGFPGGETIRDVCARTQDLIKELIAEDDGKNYLVSTHGCAMRAMINHLNDDPDDYWYGHAPYNCSVTVVEVEKGTPRLVEVDKVYYDRSLIVDRYIRNTDR